MAHIQSDRVQETTTVTGTGSATLLGAVTNFKTFGSRMATGDTCWYGIVDATNGAWEVGLGTYNTTGPVLARTTVLRSSNSDAAVSFAAGTKNIFITLPGDRNLIIAADLGVSFPAIATGSNPTVDPATPAAGFGTMFSKALAGRVMPRWKDSDGLDYTIQPSFFAQGIMYTYPTTGAAIGAVGMAALTTSGTLATPALAATNLLTQTRRTTISSGTTAGTVASLRNAQTAVWRGNAAGLGGFHFVARISLETLQSGMRAFVGLTDVTTAPTNVDPTTSTTPGKIGLAINANTGNWNIVTNVTGSAPTSTGLGASFPVNTTDLITLHLYAAPNSSVVNYRVVNETSGAVATGSISTNYPTSATFLTWAAWVTNNATAAAAIMGVNRIYLETDF